MIRAHRLNATAQDDASQISGWNVAPNIGYEVVVIPGSASCGILLWGEDGVLVATGAALVGTEQPCVMIPQTGQTVGMVDADLGWHLLLTTTGTESQRTIHINPAVDLPDDIHPVYGDDGMGLARATAAIDDAAHYRDDVTVSCPLGLGAGLGDVASVPVDGVAVVGQVESVTWTGTPDGTTEQAVIRRHVAIAPDAFVEPVIPAVVNDAALTDALTSASGNVLVNDTSGLVVTAVNGMSANVGVAVDGDNGGTFTIGSDGAWTFDPDGDFALLGEFDTADTTVVYHARNAEGVEASAALTVTVSRYNTAPTVVDDESSTNSATACFGNILTNDSDAEGDALSVSQVAGSASNVGVAVAGSNGGLFTIGSDGAWTFDPNSEFAYLEGSNTAVTSVNYYVSDGREETFGTLTITVSPSAGLQLIGTSIGTGSLDNYEVAIPAGAQEGDLVLVITGCFATGHREVGVVSHLDYIELADLYRDDSYDTNLSVNYKFLGADPETSITVYGNGAYTTWGAATVIMLWRGVDSQSPLDVPVTTATGSNSANANPPAISPITAGAVVIAAAGWTTQTPQNPPGFPDGYENKVSAIMDPGSAFTAAVCSKPWSGSGSEDPGAFSESGSTASCSWCAVTVALRPA